MNFNHTRRRNTVYVCLSVDKLYVLFFRYFPEIVCTAEMKVAFDNADVAIFLGALPRKFGRIFHLSFDF